jgi:hypothetical protein
MMSIFTTMMVFITLMFYVLQKKSFLPVMKLISFHLLFVLFHRFTIIQYHHRHHFKSCLILVLRILTSINHQSQVLSSHSNSPSLILFPQQQDH